MSAPDIEAILCILSLNPALLEKPHRDCWASFIFFDSVENALMYLNINEEISSSVPGILYQRIVSRISVSEAVESMRIIKEVAAHTLEKIRTPYSNPSLYIEMIPRSILVDPYVKPWIKIIKRERTTGKINFFLYCSNIFALIELRAHRTAIPMGTYQCVINVREMINRNRMNSLILWSMDLPRIPDAVLFIRMNLPIMTAMKKATVIIAPFKGSPDSHSSISFSS